MKLLSEKKFRFLTPRLDNSCVRILFPLCSRNAKDEKFVMSGDFDMPAFEAFIRDFLAGNLEPYLKSEPLPADGNAGK